MADRDYDMYIDWKNGLSIKYISEKYNLCYERVRELVLHFKCWEEMYKHKVEIEELEDHCLINKLRRRNIFTKEQLIEALNTGLDLYIGQTSLKKLEKIVGYKIEPHKSGYKTILKITKYPFDEKQYKAEIVFNGSTQQTFVGTIISCANKIDKYLHSHPGCEARLMKIND